MDENRQNPIGTGQSVRIVSPEAPRKKGKKKVVWVIFGMAFVAIAVLAGFYILGNGEETPEPSPTPFVSGFDETLGETTDATPEPTVDKAKVSIEVLNGTGVSGEAGFLQTKLKALGYSDIEAGNADNQNNKTTQVTFSSSLADSVVEEILQELKSLYQEVNDKTSSTQSVDVQIITGLRKGQTAKPSATPTVTPTPTATSSATPTPTP